MSVEKANIFQCQKHQINWLTSYFQRLDCLIFVIATHNYVETLFQNEYPLTWYAVVH